MAAPADNEAAVPETELVQVNKKQMDKTETVEQPSDRNIEADAPLIQQVESGARLVMIQEEEQAPPKSQHASADGGTAVEAAQHEAKNDERKNEEDNKAALSDLPELILSDKDKHEEAAEAGAAEHVVDHKDVQLEENGATPLAQDEADKV